LIINQVKKTLVYDARMTFFPQPLVDDQNHGLKLNSSKKIIALDMLYGLSLLKTFSDCNKL